MRRVCALANIVSVATAGQNDHNKFSQLTTTAAVCTVFALKITTLLVFPIKYLVQRSWNSFNSLHGKFVLFGLIHRDELIIVADGRQLY